MCSQKREYSTRCVQILNVSKTKPTLSSHEITTSRKHEGSSMRVSNLAPRFTHCPKFWSFMYAEMEGERPGGIYHVSDPDRRKRRSRRRHQTIEWFWGSFLQCLSVGVPNVCEAKKKLPPFAQVEELNFVRKMHFFIWEPLPLLFLHAASHQKLETEGLEIRLESECCKVMFPHPLAVCSVYLSVGVLNVCEAKLLAQVEEFVNKHTLLFEGPSPLYLDRHWCHKCSQTFPLCFWILQAIKNWRRKARELG